MLKIGFSLGDIKTLSLTQVLNYTDEYSSLVGSSSEEDNVETRQATQQDIDALLS